MIDVLHQIEKYHRQKAKDLGRDKSRYFYGDRKYWIKKHLQWADHLKVLRCSVPESEGS